MATWLIKTLATKWLRALGYHLHSAKLAGETPIDLHKATAVREGYEHFKDSFADAMLFEDASQIRRYAIERAMAKAGPDDLFLEFGVAGGEAINALADQLAKTGKTIFGFDAFLGLQEDWIGQVGFTKGYFNRSGKAPPVRQNVRLVVGWVQETLDRFLDDHKARKIAFVHMDMDTYSPTRFALERLRPFLRPGSVILFDEFYAFPNWQRHEYRALIDTLDGMEYRFIGFATEQAAIAIVESATASLPRLTDEQARV